MSETEVLDSRPPARSRRWLPALIGLAVFLVVLVGAGALVSDWALRNVEMRSLITAIESSEQAMTVVQDGVAGVLGELDSGQLPEDDGGTALKTALSKVAADGNASVAGAADRIAAVRIAPWHREVLDAQAAYLAHNEAWQAYLAAAAEDPTEFGKPQDLVNDSFAAAEAPLLAAVPRPWLFALRDRVEEMFIAGQPADSGDGQQVAT